MNMNERLRKKVGKRNQNDVEEFGAQYRKNARNFNASEYENAEKQIRKFRKK